jgi:hypothetical protein
MMSSPFLSGEHIFFRYAFPCAEDKLRQGKISEPHYLRLKEYAETGERPPRSLLKYCFPHAFQALRDYAQNSFSQSAWDVDVVTEYWRYGHGKSGECRVREATVRAFLSEKGVLMDEENGAFLNIYGLSLLKGDPVYLHRRIVIEKK